MLRTFHPRLALLLAVVVALLAALMGRPLREVLVTGGAVLLTQCILGMSNDLLDRGRDARSGARKKPVAEGMLPAGNVSFTLVLLLLLAVPMSLQNGAVAGLFVLATLPVGFAHNRWLGRTPLSFVGWAATFALDAAFLAYGGWGLSARGTAPTGAILGAAAFLGLCAHLITALRDLPDDDRAGVPTLPLVIARRIGAAKLMVITILLTVVALGVFVYVALTIGVAQ